MKSPCRQFAANSMPRQFRNWFLPAVAGFLALMEPIETQGALRPGCHRPIARVWSCPIPARPVIGTISIRHCGRPRQFRCRRVRRHVRLRRGLPAIRQAIGTSPQPWPQVPGRFQPE
jgi:hypothetical protein